MSNRYRGEIAAELDGKTYHLCLTLGALADLEQSFGAEGISGLAARFEQKSLSARDLLTIIACGLRGAGNAFSNEEVAALKVSDGLQGYVRIAAELLAATFGQTEAEADVPAIPPMPQDA